MVEKEDQKTTMLEEILNANTVIKHTFPIPRFTLI
jgi:hypothetical protein